MLSENLVNMDSGNGSSPVRGQAIIWTNDSLMSIAGLNMTRCTYCSLKWQLNPWVTITAKLDNKIKLIYVLDRFFGIRSVGLFAIFKLMHALKCLSRVWLVYDCCWNPYIPPQSQEEGICHECWSTLYVGVSQTFVSSYRIKEPLLRMGITFTSIGFRGWIFNHIHTKL